MTIYNKEAFMRALWDWGFLNGCFGTSGCKLSDIDGMVERNGHVLFIEAKPPGKELNRGQARAFEAIAGSGFTVMTLWGNPSVPQQLMIWPPGSRRPNKPRETNVEDTQQLVGKWFDWANTAPKR